MPDTTPTPDQYPGADASHCTGCNVLLAPDGPDHAPGCRYRPVMPPDDRCATCHRDAHRPGITTTDHGHPYRDPSLVEPVTDADGLVVPDAPAGSGPFFAGRVRALDCPHYMAASERKAGYRVCEHCA